MSRVIDAVLRLRDEFTKPLEKSINLMTSASKAGEKTRKSIEKFGKGIASAGQSLTAAITAPTVAAGAASVKFAVDFESAMSQVQATMGITKDATTTLNGETVNTMDALEKLARQLGADTKYSASEAAEAMNNMAMAGYDVQKTYDTLPTVLSLASAGNLDLDYATQLVANGMAVMGDRCESAQQMADMLAVTASSAYGSVADFGEGLLVAGGQAAVCGQNLQDTYTALGILGDNGIIGSEGGTALRNTLKNLYQPTDKAAETLDKLGIKTSDANGNLLDMQDVLQQLDKAMSGMSEADRSTAMAEIFDTRTIAAASALIGNAGERWDELNAKIEGASDLYDGQGAAAGMAATQLDNLAGQWTILTSALEELAISFGDILLPYVKQGVEWVQGLVDKFNSMDDTTKKNIVKFAAMAAAAGPLILGFGKLIVLGSKILGVFAKVRGVFTGVKAAGGVLKFAIAGLTSPIGLVVAAFAGIVAIVAVVITHFDEFKAAAASVYERLSPTLDKLGKAFSKFGELVSPIIEAVGNLASSFLVGAFEGAAEGINTALDGIATAIEGISDTLQGVIDFVNAVAEGDWTAAWEAVKKAVVGVLEGIGGAFETVIGIIQTFWQSIFNGVDNMSAADAATAVSTVTAASGKTAVSDGRFPANAAGTSNWRGGWTRVNEKGGEIMNLPSGTQIIPHDASRNTPVGGNITIAKLADSIIVREDADIDKIGNAIVRKIQAAKSNRGGWTYNGAMA
jgi:TP901 family phage tail tape measure protein